MAADDTGFAQAAFAIVAPLSAPRSTMQTVRTLLTTEHAYDAGVCGFDGPTEPGVDGGFSVTFDGRGSVGSVEIILSDNEVVGAAAMEQLGRAILEAAKLARAMGRVS